MTGLAVVIISAIGITYYLQPEKKKKEEITEHKLSVKPLISNMDLNFQEYFIHPDSSAMIERNTGTQIQIPASCFRRADGSAPSEKITLRVREFHDPTSIVQAGVPMEVAGTNGQYLQSAGMIEMHAYENGSELKISQDKSINIELAGYRASDGYSLYYLENNQSWQVTDTFENTENKRKKKRIAQLSIPTPVPDTTTNTGFIFTIDADINEKPELKPFINQSWVLAENIDDQKLKRALRNNWSIANVKMTNKRKMEYRITFSIDVKGEDDKHFKESFSILATPVFETGMSKKEQRREMERRMDEYVTLENQRIEELERVKKQADLVNSFKAQQMGVYNIDKIMLEEIIITNVHFDFESELYGSKDEHKVFLILEENNSVIPVNRENWASMSLPINKKFHFIAVLPNSRIALVSSDQIHSKLNQSRKEITLSSERKPAEAYFNATKPSLITGN
jgi:hypothetical protein